ncbi:unnamed protein product, partial [marine sediment metagenome]
DLEKRENERIEKAGYKNFFIKGIYPLLKSKSNGECTFLTKDNLCKIYKIRPATCRLQPFTISEYDFEEEKLIVSVPDFMLSTCKGFHKGEMDRKILIEVAKVAEEIFDDLKNFFSKMTGLPRDSTQNIKNIMDTL